MDRSLGFGSAAAVLALIAAVEAVAAATLERGPYHVEAVELRGLAGEVTVEVAREADGVSLRAEGPDDRLAELGVEAEGGRLTVTGPRLGATSSTVVVGTTTVVVSGGGGAQVTIGGLPAGGATAGDAEPLAVRLRVPEGTSLDVVGFVGTARIGDTLGPVRLRLASGDVRLGRVGAAELVVQGSGDVRAEAVEGERLTLAVDGSGSVAVDDGSVGDLTARVNGAGTLRFGGRAESARVGVNGTGTVELARVDARPEVDVNGVGRVAVGNW